LPGEWKAKIEAGECIRRARPLKVQDPIETKIHPRRAADAKFESSRGVIIDPAVEEKLRESIQGWQQR
jgi:hypothetical protein